MANKEGYIKTVLDDLPIGGEEQQETGKLGSIAMPEGLNHRKLCRDVMNIAWPAFMELVLTQLTHMADTIMVGHLPGELGIQALTAVGLCGQPIYLLQTLMMSLNIGATAVIARYRGMGDREKANRVFSTALVMDFVLALFFMVLGLAMTPQLIHLLSGDNISEISFGYAVQYFRIQMIGFIPLCLTTTVTAALRGVGDARTPLIYNTIANVVNIICNYLLIYGKFGCPALDVRGASIATVIGQVIAFVIALVYMLNRSRYLYLNFRQRVWLDFQILSDIVRIGLPAMVEQMFMRVGAILYSRTVASLGDIPYATHQVCNNISSLAYLTGQAYANASTTLMGQSLGKKRIDMAHLYSRDTCRLGVVTALVLSVLFIFFGRPIVGLFNSTPEIMDTGRFLLLILAYILPLEAIQFIYTGSLRGAGDTQYPAIITFITVLIIRSGLAMLFIYVFHTGVEGAWYAFAIDQTIRTTLITVHYYRGKWRNVKLKDGPLKTD